MRCTYIGLAAALGWSGVSGARIDKVQDNGVDRGMMMGAHRILADIGSHRKNASSVSLNKFAKLELRQGAGQCGATAGKCPGTLCCSDYGFCGDSVDHCAPLFNCQPQYGTCGWPRTEPAPTSAAPPPPPPPPAPTTTSVAPPPPPPPPTTTSRTSTSAPPPPPPPPTTTSSTSVYVPPPPPPPPSSTTVAAPPPPAATGLRVTTNGMCGNSTICIGSNQFGPCCSQFFWCGSSLEFCGAGCQSSFGACFGNIGGGGGGGGSPPPVSSAAPPPPPPVISTTIISLRPPPAPTTTSTTAAPPPPPPPPTTAAPPPPPPPPTTSARPTTTAVSLPPGLRSSTDGTCGSGVSCLGSTYGRCCSQFGFCGDGDQFCPPIVGCQPDFGYCDPAK